jgi:hypothetical protein
MRPCICLLLAVAYTQVGAAQCVCWLQGEMNGRHQMYQHDLRDQVSVVLRAKTACGFIDTYS